MPAETMFVALILEDEALISIDLEMTFTAAGFEVFAVATCAEAQRWLDGRHPDILIMDIKLRDGTSHAVAAHMFAADIPFIVHSGEQLASHSGDIFAKGEWLGKPASADLLVASAKGLLAIYNQRRPHQTEEHDDRYQEA